MKTVHLTDEDLQAYLDNGSTTGSDEMDSHLAVCPACREQLQTYRELYTLLETDTTPGLSAGFADRVVSAVQPVGSVRSQKHENALIAAFFLIASAIGIYFLNPLSYLQNAAGTLFKTGGEVIAHWLGVLNGNLPFLVALLFILFLVQVIDLRLTKPRL